MEQAQGDALAGTGVAMHHGEAAFARQAVLDTPAEVIELGGTKTASTGMSCAKGLNFRP
ncbi:hypothetical protein PO002_38855 [Cupriavidus necator]|uniref:hypothetical protein n=1 Tax=Cupriavidus necator TaxID=106590 RepID=UPI0039C2ED3B